MSKKPTRDDIQSIGHRIYDKYIYMDIFHLFFKKEEGMVVQSTPAPSTHSSFIVYILYLSTHTLNHLLMHKCNIVHK